MAARPSQSRCDDGIALRATSSPPRCGSLVCLCVRVRVGEKIGTSTDLRMCRVRTRRYEKPREEKKKSVFLGHVFPERTTGFFFSSATRKFEPGNSVTTTEEHSKKIKRKTVNGRCGTPSKYQWDEPPPAPLCFFKWPLRSLQIIFFSFALERSNNENQKKERTHRVRTPRTAAMCACARVCACVCMLHQEKKTRCVLENLKFIYLKNCKQK